MISPGDSSIPKTNNLRKRSAWADRFSQSFNKPNAPANNKDAIDLEVDLNDDEIIRWGLVLRTRAAIKAGTYETPAKLSATVEELAKLLLPE